MEKMKIKKYGVESSYLSKDSTGDYVYISVYPCFYEVAINQILGIDEIINQKYSITLSGQIKASFTEDKQKIIGFKLYTKKSN